MANIVKIVKNMSTGMKKAEKLAFRNTDKISKQGNKEKISGSVKNLKKNINKVSTGKAKAAMRASQFYDSNTVGLGLIKGSNKKTGKATKMAKKVLQPKKK